MWSLTDASPGRLYELAREIETSARWSSFLTPQEHQIFELALNHSLETWTQFLKGGIRCQLRFAGNDESSVVITDMDPIALAFRVRYMLWESQIENIGTSSGSTPKVSGSSTTGSHQSSETQTEIKNPTKKQDEDYDDDYDDDDDEEDANNGNGDSSNVSKGALDVLIVDTKQEDSEPDTHGRIGAVLNSSKMYDTFEFDLEKMKRFQRLKDSDEQIRRDGDDNDPTLSEEFSQFGDPGNDGRGNDTVGNGSSLSAFAKTAQFGSANLCLKHLLTTIENKRSELQVTDIELRNLISDVRKNRSKWASEERIGQEELYEACERVVQELRSTTEHSTAFLNKVSKREAPNYYDIIKNPMDLNTVMRKLRALQYNSKSEFVDDLNLIWSNCLTYNSDPAHFLRVHAIAMRKKTQALAPLIPDVTIRSRAEVEAEAEKLEKEAREQRKRRGSDSDHGHSSKRKMGVTPAKFKADEADDTERAAIDTPESGGETNQSPSDKPMDTDSLKLETNGSSAETESKEESKQQEEDIKPPEESSNGIAAGGPQVGEDATTDGELEGTAPPPDSMEEEEYQVPDAESAFWNSATRRRRIQYILGRQAMFADNKLQMDAPITVRTPVAMMRFDKTIRGEDMAGQIAGLSLLSTDQGEEPFMIEYEANAGIPPSPEDDSSAWITAPIPKLHELPPSRYLSHGIMTDLVNRNLNEMQLIRRLCAKITYIKDLQSGQLPMQHEPGAMGSGYGLGPSDYPGVADPEEDISSRLPGAIPFDSRAAYSSIRRTVAKIGMQSGFEAAQPRAVDTLASIAGDYLTKLGETLVANLEAPESTASFNSILTGSLESMGVSRLSQLTKYMGDDVFRQGRRLSTFRSRLNEMLVEILRPEVERYQDEQFQDNSEQFVLGQFSNELGDDYFGFKDLGINEELGLSNIAVPFHLLQQRVAYQDSGIPQRGIRRNLGLDVPEYPPLTPDDIEGLQSYLKPKFEKILIKFPNIPQRKKQDNNNDDAAESPSNDDNETENPNTSYIAQVAAQVAHARAKVPTSGKLVPRKKRFDRAFILEKPEPPKVEEAKPESESTGETGATENQDHHPPLDQPHPDTNSEQQTSNEKGSSNVNGAEPEIPDLEADGDLNNEIGSLAFDNDTGSPANGFAFDDSLPTGSLLLQGEEDEEEEEEDFGDAGDNLGFDFLKK